MNDEAFGVISFSVGLVLGVGVMFLADKSELLTQDKTIANLEAEIKTKPVITVEGLGICQVHQGGKVYMLIDITEEMQANQATDEIGLEEKHNQLMESYEEAK
jgi:hypothetical protein